MPTPLRGGAQEFVPSSLRSSASVHSSANFLSPFGDTERTERAVQSISLPFEHGPAGATRPSNPNPNNPKDPRSEFSRPITGAEVDMSLLPEDYKAQRAAFRRLQYRPPRFSEVLVVRPDLIPSLIGRHGQVVKQIAHEVGEGVRMEAKDGVGHVP